jgi:hypothetical protein
MVVDLQKITLIMSRTIEEVQEEMKDYVKGSKEYKELARQLRVIRARIWRENHPTYYLPDNVKKRREKSRKKIKSNLYLITNSAWEGFVKIGRAKDVDTRLKSYNTGSPFRDYKVQFKAEFNDILLVEEYIYGKYEMLNEWTKADWRDIKNDIIQYILSNNK